MTPSPFRKPMTFLDQNSLESRFGFTSSTVLVISKQPSTTWSSTRKHKTVFKSSSGDKFNSSSEPSNGSSYSHLGNLTSYEHWYPPHCSPLDHLEFDHIPSRVSGLSKYSSHWQRRQSCYFPQFRSYFWGMVRFISLSLITYGVMVLLITCVHLTLAKLIFLTRGYTCLDIQIYCSDKLFLLYKLHSSQFVKDPLSSLFWKLCDFLIFRLLMLS